VRLRAEGATRSCASIVSGALLAIGIAFAPLAFAAENGSAPTEADVKAAVEKLEKDPNLGEEKPTPDWHWKGSDSRPTETPSWAKWLSNAFSSIGRGGRLIVWLAGGFLALLLIYHVIRFAQDLSWKRGTRAGRPDAPTHVRDLDIRPESLPDDIGAAARALWDQGEHRAALSLLYRGLLSRLVHQHAVPIRDSSTEGDCVTLARQHLAHERSSYVAQLVALWQRAVYGGHEPATPEVHTLCGGFAAALTTVASAPGEPA
jgi:hypothetical protein